MSATNSTTKYKLPQYVGTDKPTWLGDFNSAMATIDKGMGDNQSAISQVASDLQKLATNLLADAKKACHPVGSYYWSDVPTSPSQLFGGVWQSVKDVFIFASGDMYAAGSTGGSPTVTLTVPQLPTHDHQENEWDMVYSDGGNSGRFQPTNGSMMEFSKNCNPARKTYKSGGDQPHENMPPFKVAYCWVRTA